jgi:hypothetical protein
VRLSASEAVVAIDERVARDRAESLEAEVMRGGPLFAAYGYIDASHWVFRIRNVFNVFHDKLLWLIIHVVWSKYWSEASISSIENLIALITVPVPHRRPG